MQSLPDGLWEAVLAVDGVVEGGGAFSDVPAGWVDGTEIVHRDADGTLDLRLTRAVIREQRPRLKADPRVTLPRSGGDWVEIRVEDDDDLPFVVELVELAAAAHRPPPGTTPKPPPTGADLDRRRRFH